MIKRILFPLLILVIVCLCYLNCFHVQFLWDDRMMIIGNPLIRDFSNIKNIFFTSPFGSMASGGEFYRPFQTLSYMFDHFLWGLNPWGFHLTSLLFHLGSTLLLYWLAFQLFNCRNIALITSLLWGIHPININAVTYLSGRGDLLSVFFVLASANFYLQGRLKNSLNHLFAFFLYVIALFSKENALPFPLILLALEFLLIKKKKDTITYVSLGAMNLVMIAYIITRIVFLSEGTILAFSPIANATLLERIMTLPWILFTSIRYLVIPWPSHMEYHFVVTSFADYRLYLPFVLVMLPLPLLFSLKYKKITFFGILCLLFGLGPVSQIFLPLMATFREHWLIIPTFGLFLLLGFALHELSKPFKKIAILIIVSLTVFWGTLTVERNFDWLSPMRLYTHDLQHEPKSFLLYHNIGIEYLTQGNLEDAKKYFQLAIDSTPKKNYFKAFVNTGYIYQRQGDFGRAKEFYFKSLDIFPDRIAYQNLVAILIREKRFQEASLSLQKAIRFYPGDEELIELNSLIKKQQD